ncbi:MAG: HU family DNA-binding protein, partial [Candidatus Competibacteraceae bacterium]|nr:HU family DNA-binding protein [Candidatus Competibacteraceae bacterium]
MNKTELIETITQATDLSKVAAGKAVDAMLAAIGKSLQGGDTVVLTGFGTFSVRE